MNNLPAEFLDNVEKFSHQSLKRKDDLSILVKAYDQNRKIEDFENLSFTGKYVNGLFTVLKNSVNIPEVESVDHIKKDLSENMEKVISQLKEITFKMDDDEKKIIEEKYLKLSQVSLKNLRQLVEDLDLIKKYLNHLKRN